MQLILLILVNISYCISDSFKDKWYKTLVKSDADDWIDLRNSSLQAVHSEPLSINVHSYADRRFKFKFPFYEEKLESTLATTQGFLYMGNPRYNQPLYETRYIAPLMAGFKPTQPPRKPQDVRHLSNGTMYINQWSDMSLEFQRDVGVFTFQVQLHSDGVIKFVYKEVPIPISTFNSSHHVKVGISDAYTDELAPGWPSLVPYDTIELDPALITSNTTVVFTPVPTCGSKKNCKSCVAHSDSCVWCSSLDRCSTREGLDQYYSLWSIHSCPAEAVRSCEGVVDLTPTRESTGYNQDCNSTSCFHTSSITPDPSNTPTPIKNGIIHIHQESNNPDITDESHIIVPPDHRVDSKTIDNETEKPSKKEEEPRLAENTKTKTQDNSSMTIVTTISISAVCIAAILVISALLILKFRKPVFSPVKMEEVKSCHENCTRDNQPYLVVCKDHTQIV